MNNGGLTLTQAIGDYALESFSIGEYRRRHLALMDSARARGCDALLLTAPHHLVYVAGDPTGFQRTGIQLGLSAIILAPADSTFIVRRYEADSARVATPLQRVTDYMGDVDDPIAVIADELREMALAASTIGIALARWGFTPADAATLNALLPEVELIDLSDAIDAVAERKSDEEIEVMRRAMVLTEAGVGAFFAAVSPGISEAEVAAAVLAEMTRLGSEPAYYHPFVLAGEHAAMPHGVWSARRIGAGDAVFLEVSAALRHYHAPLVRTAIVGANAEALRLYEIAVEALEAAIEAMRPGATAGDVDRAARSVVERAGFGDSFRHRTGYCVGIDWVTRGATSLAPGDATELVPGMVFHMPLNLFARGRMCVGCSNTVAVTDRGSEPLSKLATALGPAG